MKVLTSLDPWIVTFTTGHDATIWAGGYANVGEMYEFSVYVELEEEEPGIDRAPIVMRTPANPARVSIAVARIPVEDVTRIVSG